MREQTHHESLRHVRAHKGYGTALVQQFDKDAVTICHTPYPAGVACNMSLASSYQQRNIGVESSRDTLAPVECAAERVWRRIA